MGCLLATLLIIGVIIGNSNIPEVKVELPDYQFPVEIDFGALKLPSPDGPIDDFDSPEPPASPVTPPAAPVTPPVVEDEQSVEESNTEPPEAPEAPVGADEFVRVVMYTADWCAPCRRWKLNEKDEVDAPVVLIDDEQPPRTSTGVVYPTFEIQIHNGDQWIPKVRFGGYVSAESINKQIDEVLSQEPV